jgi:uncharacterized SAM-binding protein YcdF (DUF218 family)
MFPLIAKLLTPLVAPMGIAFALWLAALWAYLFRPRWAGCLLVAGVFVVLFFASPWVGSKLLGSLENDYAVLRAEDCPPADVIVVLGGSTVPPLAPRAHVEVEGAYDRLLYAMRLYRAGKANSLILSGGTIAELSGSAMSEASQYLELALESGIPVEAIVLEERSRNTYENALYARQTMHEHGWQRALIVTSAAHMPRAMAVFRTLDIDVLAAPADVRIVAASFSLHGLLPTVQGLKYSSIATKEYIGWWVYRLRGWIG